MAKVKVTLLGTGTSQGIPVIGCQCATCLSTDPRDKRLRCSALITGEGTNVVIDVGPDFRYQMLRSGVNSLDAILLTHEHNDHIIGLDDLRPLIFLRQKSMPIYGEERVLEQVRQRFDYAFGENKYPGAPSFELIPIGPGDKIEVSKLTFEAVRVMHGGLPIIAYKTSSIGYATDVNAIPHESMDALKGLKVLILSALRQKRHHAHFSLEEALEMFRVLRCNKGVLIHMSHRMGPAKDLQAVLPENVLAGYDQMVINLDV